MNVFKKILPAIIFTFGVALAVPALAQTAIPTGLATLSAATGVNDTDTFALCQNGPGSCSTLNYVWSHVSMSQIDNYLGARSMALTNKIISGTNNTLTNLPAASIIGVIPLANIPQIPTTDITGTLQAAQFPAITGDVSIFAGTLTAALPTVNAAPGSTTCSNITTNGKGLVTSNANGTCSGGGTYTAGSGLQLVGSQFSVPSAGITSSMLAVGAAASNIGFTPLNPANNLSDVALASTARTNLGLGSLATLSSLPTTSLTGTLAAGQFPALTGDVTTIAGNLATTLATVNAAPGATTCSSVTTNAKGLVTSNANGACGSAYTAGTGLQLIGSQFSVPSAGITSGLLASGVAAANLGFTPLNPANNLSDVALASTARTNLGLGSLATLSSLPTTSLTGTLAAAQFPALTGAVTTTAGSLATTLAAGQAAANLGFTPLRPSNNLSDVSSAATSRTNLGLGSLATLSALPAPTVSVLGGALSSTAAAHNFATGLNASGALTYAQPAFTDLSGSASATQLTNVAPVNVLSLGADPTNTNDNLSIINTAMNAGKTNLYFPVGTYKFSAALTETLPNGTGVTLSGDGSQSVLSFPSGGGIAINEAQNPGDKAVPYTFHDLRITTTLVNAGNALSLNNTQQTSFAPSQIVDIHNILIDATGSGYWSNGLVINYISNFSAVNLTVANNGQYQGSCVLLQASAAASGIVYNITNSNLNFCYYGLWYGNGIQGVTVSQSNFLDHFDIVSGSSETGLDQLTVIGSQFADTGTSGDSNILANSAIPGMVIEGNDFASSNSGNTTLNFQQTGGMTVVGNNITNTGCGGAPCGVGIYVGPSQFGVVGQGNVIGNNRLNTLTTGISIAAGAYVQISPSNTYANVTNGVVNASSNASIGSPSPFGGGIGFASTSMNVLAPTSTGVLGFFGGATLFAEMSSAGFINTGPTYYINTSTPGSSCAAGTVNLTTLVVTGGIITHC